MDPDAIVDHHIEGEATQHDSRQRREEGITRKEGTKMHRKKWSFDTAH